MRRTLEFVILLTAAHLGAQPGPLVKTDAGTLRGTFDPKAQVSVFKGIPFAAPPVGDLRWREPQPVQPWAGERDASNFGMSAMQRVHGDSLPWTSEYLVQNEVSEDCLYLNVWTPEPGPKVLRPVLVFVHGGGFVEGSGEVPMYDGTALAKKGLVLVTFNYRLGALGFMAHPDLTKESSHQSSGNYGLMDQIAALHWVQKNIQAFGGDPQRVTLWGQSAGAASVGALLASPQAKGLFQRAIANSGLGIPGFAAKPLREAEEEGLRFAASHHASSLQALRALPAKELVGGFASSVLVDGWVLPKAPNQENLEGGGSDVPVMTGYVAGDGLLILPPLSSSEDTERYLNAQLGAQVADFKHLYASEPAGLTRATVIAGTRDRERVSALLWAQRRLKAHRAPVYTYFFVRAIPWPQHPEFGAFHSGELPYLFSNLQVLNRPWEPVDTRISATWSDYLKAFATTGDPNQPGLPPWAPVQPGSRETQEIGELIQAKPVAEPGKFTFWAQYLNSKLGEKAPPF